MQRLPWALGLALVVISGCPQLYAQESKNNALPGATTSDNKLLGLWRSNRELSWASAKEVEGISATALDYLNQNVFGQSRKEFTGDKMRTFFGRIKPGDKTIEFQPYRIVAQDETMVKIETIDPLNDKPLISTFYWDLGCFYELVSEQQYREYFCPEEEAPRTRFRAVPNSYKPEQ